MGLFFCVCASSALLRNRLADFSKTQIAADRYILYGIIISNLISPKRSREAEMVTETEQQLSTRKENDQFQPVTQCMMVRIGLWPGALVCSHSSFPLAL